MIGVIMKGMFGVHLAGRHFYDDGRSCPGGRRGIFPEIKSRSPEVLSEWDKDFKPESCDFFRTGKKYAKYVPSKTGTKFDERINVLRACLSDVYKQLRKQAMSNEWLGCTIKNADDVINATKKEGMQWDFLAQYARLGLMPWTTDEGGLRFVNKVERALKKVEAKAERALAKQRKI